MGMILFLTREGRTQWSIYDSSLNIYMMYASVIDNPLMIFRRKKLLGTLMSDVASWAKYYENKKRRQRSPRADTCPIKARLFRKWTLP